MNTKERIKELCVKSGITVNKLETTLEFGTGYVSKLDKSTPNSKKIQLIADYFEVPIDYLLTGKEPTDSKYTAETAHLVSQIRKDAELTEALKKYFSMSEEQKKHVIATINMIK